MTTTSLTLLDRITRGADQEAWGRFVELYTPLLLAWCRRLGLSDADTADLTQTVFVKLYESLPNFRYDPEQSFRAWLKTVLTNAWRNQARKSRPGSESACGPLDIDAVADSDPRLQLDEMEYRSHLVRRAMEMMRDNFEPITVQACLEFVVEGRPAQVVADHLGISVNAVYLAKSRVLRHLRHDLTWFWD